MNQYGTRLRNDKNIRDLARETRISSSINTSIVHKEGTELSSP